jgi:formylglycine-generating enzyme required for sulfatase activity
MSEFKQAIEIQAPAILGDYGTFQLADLREVERLLAVLAQRLRDEPQIEHHQRNNYLANQIQHFQKHYTFYQPLAGNVVPQLRLRHRDPSIAADGRPLQDLREVFHETFEFDITRLILLGEPGMGKTTTLRRLALELSQQYLIHPEKALFPIWVDLESDKNAGISIDNFLGNHWRHLGLPGNWGEAVQRGGLCFLLDGLNQIPSAIRAERMTAWQEWAKNNNSTLPYHNNWAIFSCRLDDYGKNFGLPQVHVQQLEDERMQAFLQSACGEKEGLRRWRIFQAKLRSEHGGQFRELASNPFMLSILAQYAPLPEHPLPFVSRAALLTFLADRRIAEELEKTADVPINTKNHWQTALRAFLQSLAYTLQTQGQGTLGNAANIQQAFAQCRFRQVQPSAEKLLALARNMGLLKPCPPEQEATESVEYSHHLLQEYFAACQLVTRFRQGDPHLRQHWQTAWRADDPSLGAQSPPPNEPDWQLEAPPTTGWEETLLLASGLLQPADLPLWLNAVQADNLPLAGRCAAEAGVQNLPAQSADRLRSALHTRMTSSQTHLRARIAAGLALGELGYPDLTAAEYPFRGTRVWAIRPPIQPVAGDSYTLFSQPNEPNTFPWEHTSQRQVNLPAFGIGRYPVTNAEYRYFVAQDGYQQREWWSAAGWAWRTGQVDPHLQEQYLQTWQAVRQIDDWSAWSAQFSAPQLRSLQRLAKLSHNEVLAQFARENARPLNQPAYWQDAQWTHPARPVVGINWHEAQAYCAWLAAVLGLACQLPSEVQWEAAMRGKDERNWAWLGKFSASHANTLESGILTTTPVGLFASGRAACGALDATGNVWEWCADSFLPYVGGNAKAANFGEQFRVLRGGSWYSPSSHCRCAYRNGLNPDIFNDDLGFRLCFPVGF